MPKAPYFYISFWRRVHVISLNLVAFIISIETEDSLLARAKSIDYCYILRRYDIDSKVGMCKSFKDLQTRKTSFRYIHHLKFCCLKTKKKLRETLWLVHLHSAPEYIWINFWWRTLDQANQGIDGIIITFFGKKGTKPNMNPNPISSLISSCLFCSLFYFPVPRASFPYSPFPVLVNLFHSRDQHLRKFGTLKKAFTQ